MRFVAASMSQVGAGSSWYRCLSMVLAMVMAPARPSAASGCCAATSHLMTSFGSALGSFGKWELPSLSGRVVRGVNSGPPRFRTASTSASSTTALEWSLVYCIGWLS